MLREKVAPLQLNVKPRKKLVPLVRSTLRQERKAFVDENHHNEPGDLVVASYNVHKCVGVDRRFDPARTAEVIAELQADVIALQEVDQRFGQRSGLLDLNWIEKNTGLAPVGVVGIRDSHGWHGNIVLARNAKVELLAQFDLPGAEPRGALLVDLSLPVGVIRIIAAHLGLLRRSRQKQVRTLLSAAEAKDGRPSLLVGDLNEWRLGGRSSLRALAPKFGPLEADLASFPARFPIWPLDRILASPSNIVSRIEVHDSPLARIASDHLPIKAHVRVRRRNSEPEEASPDQVESGE